MVRFDYQNFRELSSSQREKSSGKISEMLDHCRNPGEHVRGCWVVDLVLGRE